MLTGKKLGQAIKEAIDLKIATGAIRSKQDVASHFGIKTPSIYDWQNKGSIKKDKLPKLFAYFSDVVGPEHWGLKGSDWLVDHDAINSTCERVDDENISHLPERKDKLIEELVSIAENLTDRGKIELIGMAKALCSAHNKLTSINAASSQ